MEHNKRCYWCVCKVNSDVDSVFCPVDKHYQSTFCKYWSNITVKDYMVDHQKYVVLPQPFCSFECCLAFIKDNAHDYTFVKSKSLVLDMIQQLSKPADHEPCCASHRALSTAATGIGAIACIPLSSLAVINPLGMMGLTVLSKRIHKKCKKHKDTVQLIRTSKSKIEDAVSKALDDDDISNNEFTGIVTCLGSYCTEKQHLRLPKKNTN
ncbi:unnamed protein product [Mytilus coruscus]|uniref:Uncharacterized protein n=1 Tax=Mytilus coruscus TaxID=42192 RepID=A0A6J8AET2_MYTCO|nr:unnamed protein product [Mytilus coruscus]